MKSLQYSSLFLTILFTNNQQIISIYPLSQWSSPGAWCAPCVVSGSAAPVPLSTQVGRDKNINNRLEKISTSDLKLLFLSPLSFPALDLCSVQSTEVSYLSRMTGNCDIYGPFVMMQRIWLTKVSYLWIFWASYHIFTSWVCIKDCQQMWAFFGFCIHWVMPIVQIKDSFTF